MKLTNLQVLSAVQGLGALAQKKMGIKAAWKITTALKSLETYAKNAEESMQKIRDSYALLDASGKPLEAVNEKGERVPNTVQIPTDKIASFNKEMSDFMLEHVEVTNVEIALKDFPQDMELEPSVLLSIASIVVE